MTTDQIITIVTGVLEGGGIMVFLYFIIGALRKKIEALNTTIEMQSKTLDVMEKRIEETKGIGQLYKELLNEIPEDLKKYKKFIRESKDATIEELKNTIEEKDQKHKEELERNLTKIHEQEKSIHKLLKARDNMILADEAIRNGMESISGYYEKENISRIGELKSVEIYIQHKGALNIASKNIDTMKLISHGTDDSERKNQNIESEEISSVIDEKSNKVN